MNEPPVTGTSAPSQSGDLGASIGKIKQIAATIQEAGKGLMELPGLKSLSESLQNAGSTIAEIAGKIESVSSAVKSGQETGGVVGGILGGASAILGESGETAEGEEQSSLDKVREKVAALRDIWSKYYNDLRDEDGKLNTDKLKNLALEVGETILGSKKMAKVKKALALADVIRGRAEAIMTAAKSAPFPFNLPAIAFATATGQAQQSAVAQAHDGLSRVPSTGTYMLERGERVVGKRLNQDLSGFLQNVSGEAGGITNSTDRSVSNSSNFSPTINMTIGDTSSPDAVFSNRGALESMIREIYADYAQEAPFGA